MNRLMEKSYERLSNFNITKVTYHPKRPNSCEKPRNKTHVFRVDQNAFCEVPVIDYSSTFQIKRNSVEKITNSIKNLKKIKFFACPGSKKTPIQKSAYKLPSRNNTSILKKSIIKQPSLDKITEKDIVKVLKKSLARVSIKDIFRNNHF